MISMIILIFQDLSVYFSMVNLCMGLLIFEYDQKDDISGRTTVLYLGPEPISVFILNKHGLRPVVISRNFFMELLVLVTNCPTANAI